MKTTACSLLLMAGIGISTITVPVQAADRPTEEVLFSFPAIQNGVAGPDGIDPEAGLVSDKSGALYGTTDGGGASDSGVVFSRTARVPGRTYDLKAIADYDTSPGSEVTVRQAQEAIATAERFIACIEALLA
jgi:uncharacterized repeat protein (TIGR03803 family)